MSKALYLSCYSGISGNMFIGALLDAGLSESALREMVSALPVSGYELQIEKVVKHGMMKNRIAAFKFKPFSKKQIKVLTWWMNISPVKEKDIIRSCFIKAEESKIVNCVSCSAAAQHRSLN